MFGHGLENYSSNISEAIIVNVHSTEKILEEDNIAIGIFLYYDLSQKRDEHYDFTMLYRKESNYFKRVILVYIVFMIVLLFVLGLSIHLVINYSVDHANYFQNIIKLYFD